MSPSEDVARFVPVEKRRRRISVAAILALSFGALLLLTVGSVLAVSVGANYRNTVDLLGVRATLLVDALEDALRTHLSHPEAAVDGIAQVYESGGFEIGENGAMTATLSGALAAVPEATSILIFTPDMMQRGVYRSSAQEGKPSTLHVIEPAPDKSPALRDLYPRLAESDGRHWGSFVANDHGLFANVSRPLIKNGVQNGIVVAAVRLTDLSNLADQLSRRFSTRAFILDGEDKVLAHESLVDPAERLKGAKPLQPLVGFGDPVLARFGEREAVGALGDSPLPNVEISEIRLDRDVAGDDIERSYVAITRKISGYGDRPWTIGAYYERRELDAELSRATISALIGLGALVISIIAAILLGRRLSRPVKEIANQAQRVATFDLDDVKPLPRSRVREFDDQASAFNAMMLGLRAFSTYVPRSLVAKLVSSGESAAAEPREALVTVMFTDIANFTAISEQLSAAETARNLNHHFEILCRAVDEHGGTVDKFLGDGMMAFFGAPDQMIGHAAAAVSAAAQMRANLAEDAKLAAKEGRPAFQLRIGIHTGPVTVGNIGGSDRVNYTIVGDTVNVSQRLQSLGKELSNGEQTTIVISAETASKLDYRFEVAKAGWHALRGRGEAMEVFLLGRVDLEATISEGKIAAE